MNDIEKIADEIIIAIPEEVKELGLTKEQLKKLIRCVKKDPMSYVFYEQGLGGIRIAEELGLDEYELGMKGRELKKLFDTIFKKIKKIQNCS